MVIACAPCLPFSVRRYGVSLVPYFPHRAGSENIPIQCQLPEISGTFWKGHILKIIALPLHAFAPSREPLARSRRAARPDLFRTKARRRKEGRAIGKCEIASSSWPSCLRVNQIHDAQHARPGLLTHTKTQRHEGSALIAHIRR